MAKRPTKNKPEPQVYDARRSYNHVTPGILGDRARRKLDEVLASLDKRAGEEVAAFAARLNADVYGAFDWQMDSGAKAAAMRASVAQVRDMIAYIDERADGYQDGNNLALVRKVYRAATDEVMRGALYGRNGMEAHKMAAYAKIAEEIKWQIEAIEHAERAG